MTLEEALIDVGDNPLIKSPYSQAIKAIVNATINDPNKVVNLNQTGVFVLTLVYQLPDQATRQSLLTKDVGGVRNKDSYRTVVLGASVLLTVIAVSLTVQVIMGDPSASGSSSDLLGRIIDGIFGVIKAIIGLDGHEPSQ